MKSYIIKTQKENKDTKQMKVLLKGKYLPEDIYEVSIQMRGYYDSDDSDEFKDHQTSVYINSLNGMPVSAITVSIDLYVGDDTLDIVLPAPHARYAWFKTWSENEGIVESMIEAGLISEPLLVASLPPFDAKAVYCKLEDPLFNNYDH